MSAADIEVILYRLAELDKKVEEIRAEQKAIASRGICPMPGSCVVLQRDLESIKASSASTDERLRSLETLRAEGRGAALAAKALWAIVGAGGLGVLVSLYNLIVKT